MERKNFYSKVLLFGEYGIISNSNALSVPFKEFYGFLNKSTKLNQDQKHSNDEHSGEERKSPNILKFISL